MKKLRIPIALSSIYLLFYTIIPYLEISLGWMFIMFSLSPLVVIGLVIWVLKKGEPSNRTWDEGYFYDDADFRHKIEDDDMT